MSVNFFIFQLLCPAKNGTKQLIFGCFVIGKFWQMDDSQS